MPRYTQISVIIPTRNETAELPETLRRLRTVPEVAEILVSDGASTDGTRDVAKQLGCRVIEGARGRGAQLRLAARAASTEVIWMVHADTWVTADSGQALLQTLERPGIVGGAFWKVFRDPHWLMRGSRWRCWTRLHLFGRLAADQALFVPRPVLEQIGGVPDMPLMEEFELCKRLRRLGRLALAPAVVQTSARRWHEQGVLRTYLKMWRITVSYSLGANPSQLAQLYDSGTPRSS